MNRLRSFSLATLLLSVCTQSLQSSDQVQKESVRAFLVDTCADCHNGDSAEGSFSLTSVMDDSSLLFDAQTMPRWITLLDRVHAGEMPPDDELDTESSQAFQEQLTHLLHQLDERIEAGQGRTLYRRMNRLEYENTLRDLLAAPWLQVKQMLPEDGEEHHFNKIGSALDISHVQIARYMQAADAALRQVVVNTTTMPDQSPRRFYARQQPTFQGKLRYNPFNRSPSRAVFPLLGHLPDLEVLNDEEAPATLFQQDESRLEREAFGVVASAYEPLEPRFDQFRAPSSGLYEIRLCAYTFWAGPGTEKKWWRPNRAVASRGRRSEPVSLYAHAEPRLLRHLGGVDVHPDADTHVLQAYLVKGESIRPDAARLFRSRPPNWHNPLAERDGMPGVAYRWLETVGPIHEQWPPKGHQLLFGQLEFQPDDKSPLGVRFQVASPEEEATRLLENFLTKAYRRPVESGELERFLVVVLDAMQTGSDFGEAMLAGYTAVLCSPEFICLMEYPGALDNHAVASRLSYFLTNSAPDRKLRDLARAGTLLDSDVLKKEVDRLLDAPQSRRFLDAFLDYWLDLRSATATSPDELLYSDYYLDDLLVESAVKETRTFFEYLVRENRPARELIDADYAFVNERLSRHYGLEAEEGIDLKQVSLPAESPRGGLMTQASILKVTADGTNTSPVKRGAWVMDRLLGQPPPPPPPSVPGLEPDIRGAKTIREQLEKHRSVPSCTQCHLKIDPPGFALESFDVLGGWRDRYRTLAESEHVPEQGFGKNGQPFRFRDAQPVDASGKYEGHEFNDIFELKKLLAQRERQIARNLVKQLVTYATGAPVRFSDRDEIERILDEVQDDEYGVRSIVHSVVHSQLFLEK